ncbi:hypothetical protein H4R18_003340 [Coemansia javaensis]|uniref:BHLH domain-containing protein n=1 Tax=Coemansia javaensis TaxID=2761396 RepID=A0A9W8LHU2_9FUNG|nr:hypothetical protein H4R18_003340 [Coemansia javaensis]
MAEHPVVSGAPAGGLSLAEMAELLTPFLSPTPTPGQFAQQHQQHQHQHQQLLPGAAAASVFSPLTSPALVPRATTMGALQMPPPSPSVTEHIVRRQVQGHSSSSSYSQQAPRGRRIAPAASASPHHHPYRPPGQQGAGRSAAESSDRLLLLDALGEPAAAMAVLASLRSTPSLAADFAGLHLPDPVALPAAAAAASSPQIQDQQDQQRSRTLHQLGQQQHQAWAGAAGEAATPAMLMNLPVSAHHLPAASRGGIVAAAAPSAAITQSAPGSEFIHPPAPPPLRIGPASAGSVRRKSASSGANNSNSNDAAAAAAASRARRGETSRARRRARAALLVSPRATPLVPSILKGAAAAAASPGASPGSGPQLLPTPQLGPQTPAIAPRQQSHTSPRHTPIVAATSTTNILGLEAEVVTRLATKSNYQNIMEGNSEALGLRYHTEFKSGLERRRTNHKQAEQKRRDSLKTCFQDLQRRLPHVNPKLVSKIYLLRAANAYIDELRCVADALGRAAAQHGVDVDAVAAAARASAALDAPGDAYADAYDDGDGDDDENEEMQSKQPTITAAR